MQRVDFYNLGRKFSFLLLILYPQINFIAQRFGTLLYAFGALFYLFDIAQRRFIYINHRILKYIVLFCIISSMHILLFLFGEKGYFPPRPLHLHAFAILALLYGASTLGRSKDGNSWILTSVTICLLIEILIIISQFTYITYGFGLPPKADDFIFMGAITGSYGNPNNVSVMITLQIFALYKNGFLKKQSATSSLIIFSAFCAVFLTMSRVCFIIFSIFILMYYFRKANAGNKSDRLKSAVQWIFAVFLLIIFAWNFNYEELNNNSPVFNRSIERLVSTSNLSSDESAAFRMISHARLLENIHNLGIGSFSDLSYHRFFQGDDDWLLKVNPHSFIVEMSFLYGYIGLILASVFILFIAFDLISNKSSIYLSIFFIISFIFFQMIPSSLLANPLFFFLCVILALPNSSIAQEFPKPVK